MPKILEECHTFASNFLAHRVIEVINICFKLKISTLMVIVSDLLEICQSIEFFLLPTTIYIDMTLFS